MAEASSPCLGSSWCLSTVTIWFLDFVGPRETIESRRPAHGTILFEGRLGTTESIRFRYGGRRFEQETRVLRRIVVYKGEQKG